MQWFTSYTTAKLIALCLCVSFALSATARDVTFCGERIPISNSFVADKLMTVLRQHIRNMDINAKRREAQRYFPLIEYYLKQANMPLDLKYIPIIESGFRSNARSGAGAQGFWQIMPETAADWKLRMGNGIDDRNDIYKSTVAALRELARTYKLIRGKYNLSSWVLTAAAYNWGIGNLFTRLKAGSNNYFTMNLNPETASYVYKIVAIKELFEYPELYLKNFSYNLFNPNAAKTADTEQLNPKAVQQQFSTMEEFSAAKDGEAAPEDKQLESITAPTAKDLELRSTDAFKDAKLVGAQVMGKYPSFKDGDTITIKLQDNLQTLKGFQRKGAELSGKGWIVDNRIFIDLGFNSSNVILYDAKSEQGIPISSLKNKEQLILRVQN